MNKININKDALINLAAVIVPAVIGAFANNNHNIGKKEEIPHIQQSQIVKPLTTIDDACNINLNPERPINFTLNVNVYGANVDDICEDNIIDLDK